MSTKLMLLDTISVLSLLAVVIVYGSKTIRNKRVESCLRILMQIEIAIHFVLMMITACRL